MKRRVCFLAAVLALTLPAYSAREVDGAPARSVSSPAGDAGGSVEERRLRSSLQEDSDRLRQREEELRRRELELKTMEAQVDKKLAELKKLREEVNALLSRKSEAESAKARDLGQIYEKMDPSRAALLLTELDEKLAVEILGAMKKKTAGKVLGAMEKGKAVRLSAAYHALGPR